MFIYIFICLISLSLYIYIYNVYSYIYLFLIYIYICMYVYEYVYNYSPSKRSIRGLGYVCRHFKFRVAGQNQCLGICLNAVGARLHCQLLASPAPRLHGPRRTTCALHHGGVVTVLSNYCLGLLDGLFFAQTSVDEGS